MTVNPDWIFVQVPVHRSGSTLLQRVLNASEEVHLWGETNIGPKLLLLAESLARGNQRGGDRQRARFLAGERDQWTAHMVPARPRVLQATRAYVNRLLAVEGKRAGSKEIGWSGEVIHLMAEVLPRARFVLLVRNPLDTYLSLKNKGWWTKGVETFAENWAERTGDYLQTAEELPERALLVRYEDLDLEQCRRIFAFLELPFPPAVAAVLENRVGGSERKVELTEEERAAIRERCGPVHRQAYGRDLE